MHLYPDNTLQNYKTEVSLTGEFVGQWEVGMASLTYPGMWYNVSEVDTACYVFMNDASIRECKLPTGRYLRMEGLLMALNKTLNSTIPGGLDFFEPEKSLIKWVNGMIRQRLSTIQKFLDQLLAKM